MITETHQLKRITIYRKTCVRSKKKQQNHEI